MTKHRKHAWWLFLLFMISATPLCAQKVLWSANYGGRYNEQANGCQATDDNGIILLGSTFSYGNGGYDIYMIKLDSLGDTLWSKTFGGDSTEYGYALQQTDDSGFIIVGCTNSFGYGKKDIYLLKTDALGNALWEKTIGGTEDDIGYSIRETVDHGFIICGVTKSYGAGYNDVYLVKTDSAGNMLWSKTYGGSGGEIGSAVQQTPDSGFILIGTTGSFGIGYSSMYVIRTDKNGDSLWTTTYGGNRSDLGYCVENTRDGGFIFAGATVPDGAGYYDAYLVKTDPSGNIEWEQTYGGNKEERAYSVLEEPNGNFIFTGKTDSYNSFTNIYLVETDPIGNIVWSKYYGGSKTDEGHTIVEDNQQNYLLAGYSYSYSSGGSDVYLMKIKGSQTTDVNEPIDPSIPSGFKLSQNYPNPFNMSTTIEYTLPTKSRVTITIYNILGQIVKEWSTNSLPAGSYRYTWEGKNERGYEVSSGVYLYRLQAGIFTRVKKMVLLK
ncbi:MAG: T9SS type A sorting domain-containing protein [FCB group bacterium]|nr:T9SS type A sorting domain-containing protein [FCB group bacterium]